MFSILSDFYRYSLLGFIWSLFALGLTSMINRFSLCLSILLFWLAILFHFCRYYFPRFNLFILFAFHPSNQTQFCRLHLSCLNLSVLLSRYLTIRFSLWSICSHFIPYSIPFLSILLYRETSVLFFFNKISRKLEPVDENKPPTQIQLYIKKIRFKEI